MVGEADFDKVTDIIEIIVTCRNCGTRFHGTLYREKKCMEPDEEGPV